MSEGYQVQSVNPSCYLLSPRIVSSRLDPKYYDPRVLELIQNLERNENYGLSTIKKSSSKINSGPFGSSLLASAYIPVGIPYFRPLNLKSIVASLEELVFIGEDDWQRLRSSQFKSGDILVTKIGNGIGDVGIIPEGIEKANISGNLMGFRVSPDIDPYYVVTFLTSPFGQKLIIRSLTDTAKPKIETSDVAAVKLPIPDPKIQIYIGSKVRLAEKCREEANQLLLQAMADLNSAVGFDLYATQIESKFSGKGFRLLQLKPVCIFVDNDLIGNSILPTRYQPEYLERDRLIAEHVIGLINLEDIAVDFINGYDWRDFKTSGTPYLRVGNIRPNELDLSGVMYVEIQPSNLPKKFHLVCGDLLITRKGSYGFCTSVTKVMEQMVYSSEIIRVPLQKGWDTDCIALFLNSPYGRYQFDRLGTGTTMKGINHENLAEITVPKIPFDTQKTIGDKVRLSMALREKSKDLITEACRDVENLIEARLDIVGIVSGERQAPTWEAIFQNLLSEYTYA